MKEMADRIIDHYERRARDWDADRNCYVAHPWNDKPWHDRFIAALPDGEATVLDLGCGSGSPVAKYMAECGLSRDRRRLFPNAHFVLSRTSP